jgi:hypothetical protein
VTIYNDPGLFEFRNWNEYNLNTLTRNNWRASLVPAAAVIPAPIAYINVVAVKKLVVEIGRAISLGRFRKNFFQLL